MPFSYSFKELLFSKCPKYVTLSYKLTLMMPGDILKSMEERRRYYRISDSLQINYRNKRLDALNILGGSSTKDISYGGLCFPSMYDLPKGDALEMDISLPEFLNPVKAEGKIVWEKEKYSGNFRYLFGVEFSKIKPFDEYRLYGYINRRIEEKENTSVATWIG